MMTEVGIPMSLPLANLARALVVGGGLPAETWMTTPYRTAFIPRVATIGVTPMTLTITPEIAPAASVAAKAMTIADANLPESPLG